eukprot:CAMPEP_0202096314 /NCGR_PEP_ID=MMETSP0965-20130614/542_1 /ASSEMBLY_ACC=CAM_ASM_000507 /TAXON_ID=4773 /ORGANISM="Schizochytrium aggregatum, Strain ATCC28209" /LENGTH=372 /DNA_ID=CAMNT_0048664635 /DNA_START=26 /DNA_END=1141 /DNA_ORIENTATION=-
MTTAALRTVVPRIRRTGPLKATVAIAGRRWTASSGSWGVRLLYLIVVVSITGLALATPRTFARDADGALNANRVPFFWVLLALCITVFVFLQGSDPGFIEVAESGNARLELGAMVDIPLDDLSPRSPPTFGRVSHDEIYLRDLNCSREAGRDEDGATTSDDESENGASEEDEFELDLEPDERTDRQLAGLSRSARVPVRAKFCRNSGRYVATFDHYCGLLGTCIGERNHCRFWWFLFFHSFALAYLLRIVASGFRDTRAEVRIWFDFNTHALLATVVICMLLVPIGCLLFFHSFLALTNMTSYEFLRANKISYLEGTKDFDLPFSRGLFRNLHVFCIEDGFPARCSGQVWEPHEWHIEQANRDSDDIWNNIW